MQWGIFHIRHYISKKPCFILLAFYLSHNWVIRSRMPQTRTAMSFQHYRLALKRKRLSFSVCVCSCSGRTEEDASAVSVLGSEDAVMDGVCFREWLSSWHKPTSHVKLLNALTQCMLRSLSRFLLAHHLRLCVSCCVTMMYVENCKEA